MRLYANNPVLRDNPSTNLTTSVASGVTTLDIYNNIGFSSTTNLFLLSQYTDEQAEIVKGSATTSTSITLSTGTSFAHAQDVSVTLMPYDEIEFSRSDDGGSTWTVLGTVAIQPDRLSTVYIDNGGQNGSLWRYRFYNSQSTIYSNYSTSLGSSGYSPYQLESLQNRVVALFVDKTMAFLDYDEISDWIYEASEVLGQHIYASDKMGLIGYVSATVTNGIISMPADFYKLKRLSLATDGTNFYKATPTPLNFSMFGGLESEATTQFNSNAPAYYRQDSSIYVYPTTVTNYHLWYYRLPTQLVNPQDSLDMIFRAYTGMFVNYALYRAKIKDKKVTDANSIYKIFLLDKAAFMENMTTWQTDDIERVDSSSYDFLDGGLRTIGKL